MRIPPPGAKSPPLRREIKNLTELEDSANLDTRAFPALSQRKGRLQLLAYGAPTDMFAVRDKLMVVENGRLAHAQLDKGAVSVGEKRVAVVNSQAFILPDRLVYDAADDTLTPFDAGGGYIPDFEFICEAGNRLWGVCGNTVYGSPPGKPRDMFADGGLYRGVGSDGDFTAVCVFAEGALFWKEKTLCRLTGDETRGYELTEHIVPGVRRGCEKSLCVINDTLYYAGERGIYAYSSRGAKLIAEGDFANARAGADASLYYLSARDKNGVWSMYTLDTVNQVLLREDDTRALAFAWLDGRLHYLDADSGIVTAVGQGDKDLYLSDSPTLPGDSVRIKWSATFRAITENSEKRKTYTKLWVRAELAEGAWIEAFTKADDGEFEIAGTAFNRVEGSAGTRLVSIPITPKRCDTLRVKLYGMGHCVIRDVIREYRAS